MGVFPIDLSVAAVHHGLLYVHPVDIQLTDCSVIAVGRDAAHAELSSNTHSSQPIAPSPSSLWLCSLAFQLRSIDTGQPDLLSGRCATGIAVVAALDGDAFAHLRKSRSPQHQQEDQTKSR